jgi:enoyl-CoA hydratase/carnithine racemase/phenylpyruvate tautomerase PptA (4-oxalocrotonate tautomerase family)
MSDSRPAFIVDKSAAGHWRVTLDNPPINVIDDGMYDAFYDLVGEIEADPALKVVTFESANPDFFIAHYGTSGPRSRFGAPRWIDAATRLANSGVLSIAVIRGRVRGGGSEFVLACDIRFASHEKAIFGQPEVGVGLIPGGGALQRLPLLVGRSRALEIILGANDFDADAAERYGWINRAMPDATLDSFVADFVRACDMTSCLGASAMPMIDIYATAGTFSDTRKLAADAAAVVKGVENVPDIPMFRQNTAALVHEMAVGTIANVDGDGGYVRVQVLTNAGALDREKQVAVVSQLTDLVAAAANDPGLKNRTWVLLTEATPGGWGLWGHAHTNDELVGAARAEIAKLRS